MSEIKSSIYQNIVNPSTHSNNTERVYGSVTVSDERNNLCSITYLDRDGKHRLKNGVPIKISNSDNWFPVVGEIVLTEITGDDAVIVGRAINNYNSEVKKQKTLKYDIYSDGGSNTIGGSIF